MVRSIYALTVVTCGVGALVFLYQLAVASFGPPWRFRRSAFEIAWPWLLTAAFLVPSLRAAWRVARRRAFVPRENILERPVVATLVALLGGLAALGVAWFVWVFTAFSPEQRSDGNLAAPALLVTCWFALALWIGEFVLAGSSASDKAALSQR